MCNNKVQIALSDIFNRIAIYNRAKEYWDCKTAIERKRIGKRYEHILTNHTISCWSQPFDSLALCQKRLIIKGELIRTYDELPNIDKTTLKNMLHLSMFSAKWRFLSSKDKSKIIKFIM